MRRKWSTVGKEQLHSYANATGAPLALWSNGIDERVWNRKDPNVFITLPKLPQSNETVDDVWEDDWYIGTLEQLEAERNSRSNGSVSTLRELIEDMENEVLANAGVDVFEEVFKLIFVKLYDESLSSKDNTRKLKFRNSNTASQLTNKINKLFTDANAQWPGVFRDTKVNLEPRHLQVCVGSMEGWKLLNSNLDIIDNAFEFLVNKSSKAEKGQYFTPRWVVDMCVKMMNPQPHESVVDTACGSSGFTLHAIFHVWRQILDSKGMQDTHLLTSHTKPDECSVYVRDKVFGIDFDEKCVRVSRCLNLIAGDGESKVLHLNALNYPRWADASARETWSDIYHYAWSKLRVLRREPTSNRDFNFDIVLTNPPFAGNVDQADVLARYETALDDKGRIKRSVARDALFIERNLDVLRPGGRMAIVLPIGRLNNRDSRFIRHYIMDRCRLLAVVGLDGNTFQPHTATKTCVVFVQKWNDDPDAGPMCPRTDDYDVFLADQSKPCTTSNGTRLFVKRGREYVRDKFGHYVMDHDLFNHEQMTSDGVAEAFAVFASEQGLSFMPDAASDSTSGFTTRAAALKAADRWDAKFFNPHCVALLNHASSKATRTFKLGDKAEYNDRGVQPSHDASGEVPMIMSGNIREGWLDYDGFKRVSMEWYLNNPKSHVKHGDILTYTTGKYIGRTAVFLGHSIAACNNHVNILRIRDEDPLYVAFVMNSSIGKAQTEKFKGGGGQGELYPDDIAQFEIPVVSEAHQDTLINLLQDADTSRREAVSLMSDAATLLNSALLE